LWPGITVDHPAKIKARSETESVLYAKTPLRGMIAKRRFKKLLRNGG
jgi:hypothetical protein